MATIVWFRRVTEYNRRKIEKDTEYEQQLLEKLPQIRIFDDANRCVDYITNCPSKSVYAILSDDQGLQVFSLIYQLEQLVYIYVLYEKSFIEPGRNNTFIKTCYLIRGIFKNISKLIHQLNYDSQSSDKLETIINNPFNILVNQLNTIDSLDDTQSEHIRFQIIVNSLLRSNDSSNVSSLNCIRKMMIDECRQQCSKNARTLKEIDDFEFNETKYSSIQWWTKDSFIYRLLNTALVSRYWNSIIKYQYFLVKLYNELKTLHHDQYSKMNARFDVYRGQSVYKQDLETLKNNIGGLVSFNYFLATSLHKDVACLFAYHEEGKTVAVVFQISIDTRISSAVFADISQFSFIPGEDEILVGMGAVFRVDSVTDDHESGKCIVHLSLADPNSDSLFVFMLDNTKNKNTAEILYEMGEYETAKIYCQLMIENNHDPLIHRSVLGKTCKELGEYTNALENHFHALQYVHSINQCTAIYYNIGLAYLGKKDYHNAIRYYQEAIELECVEGETIVLAEIYHDIGLAYMYNGCLSIGLNYLHKALDIQKSILPDNHYHLGITYANLGDFHRDQNELDQALNYYQHSVDILHCSRRIDDGTIITVYTHMIRIYLQTKQYDMARKIFEQLAQIYGSTKNALKLANIYLELVTTILLPQQDILQSIDFIEYILRLREAHFQTNPNHKLIGLTYYILGCFQMLIYRPNSFSKDPEYLQSACCNFKRAMTILKDHQIYMLLICEHLGLIYHDLHEYSLSIDYLKQSLQYSSATVERSALQYRNLACVYANTGQFQDAIEYLTYSIDIAERKSNFAAEHNRLSSYALLGIYYKFTKSYVLALKYLSKALSLWRITAGPFDTDRVVAAIYYHTADIYHRLNCRYLSYVSQLFYFHHKQRLGHLISNSTEKNTVTDPYFEYVNGFCTDLRIE